MKLVFFKIVPTVYQHIRISRTAVGVLQKKIMFKQIFQPSFKTESENISSSYLKESILHP